MDEAPQGYSVSTVYSMPLIRLVKQIPNYRSLELESSILEPGREIKALTADLYFDPAALVVFTHFNYAGCRAFRKLASASRIEFRKIALHPRSARAAERA